MFTGEATGEPRLMGMSSVLQVFGHIGPDDVTGSPALLEFILRGR